MNYYVSGENVNGRPCRGVVHVVKKGDTLYKISRVYDVKVADSDLDESGGAYL